MDPIFNLFKVKFAKLDELISDNCHTITRDSKVNFFINLEPVFKKLVTANVDEYLRVKTSEKSFEMISNIINLASHYRLFFTKNKIYSNVYLYFNHPFNAPMKNGILNPNYRDYYEHKYTKDAKTAVFQNMIDDVITFTKLILEYVQGVYLITSGSIESSIVPAVITKEFPTNNVNFILSNDKYDYQYANRGFYIIRPKKDDSYIVTKDNLIQTIKTESKVVNDINLDSGFYPFLLSLLGDKYRNIEKIKGVGLAGLMKTINKAIEEDLIGKDTTNINILSNVIKEEYRGLVLANYYCIDIETQLQMLNLKDLFSITSQIKDKFDNVALKELNDKYFTLSPIQLLELTGANNLIRKKRNDIFL